MFLDSRETIRQNIKGTFQFSFKLFGIHTTILSIKYLLNFFTKFDGLLVRCFDGGQQQKKSPNCGICCGRYDNIY